MRKFFIISLISAAFLYVVSCSKSKDSEDINDTKNDEITDLSLLDSLATKETKALYANLWEIQKKGFMFGHHDDLWYGRKWYNEPGRSDTKDVCGDYPAVFSVDFGPIMDDRCLTETGISENTIRRRVILEAYKQGEVIMACMHLNNPLTGGDSWDNSRNDVVKEILTDGSEVNIRFKTWLNRLASFLLNLRGDNGELIPIIFRPFHEHTQTWSWWGSSCTTQKDFIDLWQFTVKYLRDGKGVHNFIYAISPQMDTPKTKNDFLYRWPGNEYVDFIGMDCYQGLDPNTFTTNMYELSKLSKELNKPCGVTETGVKGICYSDGSPVKDYWTKQILTPALGQTISMIVMWRNAYDPAEEGQEFYSVFKDHASESNFLIFYKNSITFFSNDLPNMYSMPTNINVN
jgi:mannan endo-1,4-beta-mannosidase